MGAVSLFAASAIFIANELMESLGDDLTERRMLNEPFVETVGSRILSNVHEKHRRARQAKAREMKLKRISKQQSEHEHRYMFNFDSKTIEGKAYTDVEGIQEDGTFLLFHDEHHRGPNMLCMPLVKAENQIKRVHYHYSDCKTFDDMFGHRIAVVYGIKMIAHAMHKPFTFSCGLAEGETSHGALDLMLLNSRADLYPVRSEEDHSAKELCQRYCAGRYCDWHSPNLDMASELMISDWKYLTQPDRVQVTDHDDAVIHLRLGGGLHSTYGANEGKGVFPHGTYINLIKQAQEEKGAIRSIGIVTAPFKGNHVRVFDSSFTRLSELITHDLSVALELEFPGVEVRLHNSDNESIIGSLARLVHARKVAICGCSTFCPYALVAAEGIGYIYNPAGYQNVWVGNASERYENFRLFDTPMLNGLIIANDKYGWRAPEKRVIRWLREQDPNVGNVDIFRGPIFRHLE